MKNYKKLPLALIALAMTFSAGEALAQGGSNYSAIGVGDFLSASAAAYDAMGGTASAMPSLHAINPKNPALWGAVSSTRLQLGYRFNQNIVSTDKAELWQNNGMINGVTALFSIDTSLGAALSLGFVPQTSVNYLTAISFPTELGIAGRTTYQGSGGIYNAYLGGAIEVIEGVSLGAQFISGFGTISRAAQTDIFDAEGASYINADDDEIRSFGYKLGGFWQVRNDFALGAYTLSQPIFKVNNNTVFDSQAMTDTTIMRQYEAKMPLTYGFGASYLVGKFLLGADLDYFAASGLTYRVEESAAKYRDALSLSFGFSRLGNRSINADPWDKATYKAGLNYRNLYYSVNGRDLNEYSASLGLEMPLPGAWIIDAAFTFGARGSTDAGLVREYFGRFTIDMSLGETWFKPFKRQY
ncbi:MAG: hypothetical protein ACM3U1_07125 [Chloroflexota bacterium]